MRHSLQPEIIPFPGAKGLGIYLLPGFQRDPRGSVTQRRTDQRTFSRSSGDWRSHEPLNEVFAYSSVGSRQPAIRTRAPTRSAPAASLQPLGKALPPSQRHKPCGLSVPPMKRRGKDGCVRASGTIGRNAMSHLPVWKAWQNHLISFLL